MRSEALLHQGAAKATEPLVVSCGCSALQQARLRDALHGIAPLRSLEGLAALSVADWLHVPDTVVIAIEPAAARDCVALVREIRSRCPRTALVAYCSGVTDTPASIGALAAAGIHQFLFADINDRGCMLRAIFDSARQQCVTELVTSALRKLLSPLLLPIVEAALTRPEVVTDVSTLAQALGVHRKTIFNRCSRAGRLGPQELLTWVRIALVAHLLESTGYTVEDIALQLGYPSPTALRNTIKRHVGVRATEIRSGGGLELVLDRLRDRIRLHVV
ncbi:MAG TPA: helix-turn-helix transcriptional regulator [Gemmatimonadaceae bacterium]|nr:helix-turn-helix transcriptional regulator [Gemmatimonadaceae bacterium]